MAVAVPAGAVPGLPFPLEVPLRPRTRIVVGSDPAAGAAAELTVPGHVRWFPYGIRVTLVTSATAGARQVYLTLDDQTTEFLRIPSFSAQAASQTGRHHWLKALGAGLEFDAVGADVFALPEIELLPGWGITITAAGLLAADNFGPVIAHVLELPALTPQAEAALLAHTALVPLEAF